MDTQFEIRVGGPADVPCMAAMADAFRRQLGYDGPTEAEFAVRIPSLFDDAGTDLLVAFGPARHCAGFVQMRYRRNIWTPSEEAYIEDLFVAQDSRRLGLGARLLETAIDRARTRDCSVVTLETSERNTRALALYERYGFRSGGGPEVEMKGGRQLWLKLAL
jgi:ribosomal protein S18 acetylase RimI-like enzyme